MRLSHEENILMQTEQARYQAIGYVWGRQDAGDAAAGNGSTTYAVKFGEAYGRAKREYLTELRTSFPNVRDAFAQWQATGRIMGVGQILDEATVNTVVTDKV